jgi:Fe-S cluster biogenesis protein NfuA
MELPSCKDSASDGRGRETNARPREVEGDVNDTPTLEARVDDALEAVRPAIRRDGGDVWLIRIADRVAYVQMLGACGGCAMVMSTLKDGIERVVRERCPEIERVEHI